MNDGDRPVTDPEVLRQALRGELAGSLGRLADQALLIGP